ncbi:MAG: aminodeoxychorismate synthase component I [Betaproteobacteria bacterium]|nr:aminodeoxychorismate synthase component I [Betaproteobacteria bacterium]
MPQPSALIDFVATGAADPGLRLAFDSPAEILVAHTPGEVAGVLDRARAYAVGGRWCVGYVRYEAAQAFDAALRVHAPDGPLAWFAVFESAAPWPDSGPAGHRLGAGHLTLARSDFDRAMSRLHAAIADGETYQVNLTAPWQGDFSGCPRSLFEALHRAQPACYAAFLDTGEEQVLSVSPELFFDWRGDTVTCRPMKGTAARGENAAADAAQAERLRLDAKERAENLMIVDLIRNDLSRVALPFSVRVPSLFDVRAWPTVWQMTSDIEARVPPGLALSQLFAALFPCGSVTGAPKVRAMHWIHELETGPRGVYCGAIGVLQPGGATTFNVAIRTLVLRRGQAVCGLGSGITADARADGEWREWHRKQRFIERARLPFDLLETLRLEAGRFTDDELHLARMAAAATHFGFPWNLERARQALAALARAHPAGAWRARLRATSSGRFEATAHVLEPSGPQRGVVSPHATLPPEGAPPRLGAARRRVVSPHAALPP